VNRTLLTRKAFTTPAGVLAITAILYGAVVAGRLVYRQWDPTYFIVTGITFYDQSKAPQQLIARSRTGYDGQFYYRLALHPLSNERTAYGIRIDNPSYRAQRVLYPVLVHVLALGKASWIPWSMIIVNYLAICGLALSSAQFAQRFEVSALYGLAIPFLPSVLLGFARDLPDPLAISLTVFALLLLHSRRIKLAAFVLTLTVMARETTVVLAGALFIHSVWRSRRERSGWSDGLVLLLPIATYVLVQWWMFLRWGEFGVVTGRWNLSYPLSTLLWFVAHRVLRLLIWSPLHFLHRLFLVGELAFLGELLLFAVLTVRRSAADQGVKLSWLCYLVLAVSFSNYIWVEDWAYMRGCGELLVLSLIILLGARDRRLLLVGSVSTFALWLPLAFRAVIIQ
jgi:hypothetical protein